MKVSWFWPFMFIVMGFIIFENIGVAIAFGLGSGIIFGGIFSDKE